MKKIVLALMLALCVSSANDTNKTQVGIFEQLGSFVPLDTKFIDHTGKETTIKELSNGKPLIMTFNYHRCASICSPQLAGLSDALNKLDLVPGEDFNIATFSIDPTDTYAFAALKQKAFTAIVQNHSSIKDAWKFVVNSDENVIKNLTKLVGFGYQTVIKDGRVDYIHPAALILISSEGKITRYLNGVEYLPFDLKLALMESGEGKVGPTIARSLLYCFAYDPKNNKYIFQMEKVFAILFTLILIIFFIYLVKSRKKR